MKGGWRIPAVFVGHGSPMNALEDNEYTQAWKQMACDMPRPEAILCVSAHWLTRGTAVTAAEQPRTIHDFGGFPRELYEQQYPAPGSPPLARRVREVLEPVQVALDHEWGVDHGSWMVLKQMYPRADIPVCQLSIDLHQPPAYHYELGTKLRVLRSEGVLLLGSGNIVHNLRLVRFDETAYDWAVEFDASVKRLLLAREYNRLVDYPSLGESARLAVPTPDHFYPLLYVLGASEAEEPLSFYCERVTYGAISMRSLKIGV